MTRFRQKYGWFGDYSSWEAALKETTGYDSEIIYKKVKDALWKVKTGKAVYERDSVLFKEIQYSWPLLTGLLWIASKNNNKLNIIDFGGSLGSTYYQNKGFLGHLQLLRWNIVEQKKFVDCGKQYFTDKHLRFYYSVEDCLKNEQIKTILFSSVIQYLEKPYDFLDKIISFGFDNILFDRTAFIEDSKDRITVQIVPPTIYPASYPAWFFNEKKFVNFFKSNKYTLAVGFNALGGSFRLQDDKKVSNKGYIFIKNG